MKKTEVYVVVDTPKKAKKLKNILDMFKEEYFKGMGGILEWTKEHKCVYFSSDESKWHGISEINIIKGCFDKVSIKELRNILAKEYLKDGDFVVIKSIYNDDWVMEVDYIEGDEVHHKSAINKSSGYKDSKGFLELNFIRYATEEEKAFLEPKKELEIGKWYFGELDNERKTLFCFNGENGQFTQYGFTSNREWSNKIGCIQGLKYTEATPQEVEQALIEEAKRRGFDFEKYQYSETLENEVNEIKLWGHYINPPYKYTELFKNGQWANIIEQDNFTDSDIAIVERLHDTILDNHGYSLESKLLTDARMLANKIKSNIK